ncbi:MAG: peptidoglycan D,D-transpeptidase FtsI family protein, partial [Acidimicrobiales bacterium]
ANPFRRLRLVLVVFGVLFAALAVRLGQLQVIGADQLEALGEAQRIRTIALPAGRGAILDRNGDDLAVSLAQQTVWADPRFVDDPAATAEALAPLLGVDRADLADRLATEGAFVYLARQVTDDVAARVDDLGLPGINLLAEPTRFNPAGDLARSVLGRVDVDGVGSAGVERQYDDVLSGAPGQLIVERDPDGRTIPQGEREVDPAVAGDDLLLTIDRALQYEAERVLADQIVAMGAQGGTVVVSNPRTGEIYALANLQVLEPSGPPVATGNNVALTTVFEPGSVNKVITMSAAREEDVVCPTSTLQVPDHLQVSDHLFSDAHDHGVESWTPTDIIATSSNVGTIMLARELGPERIDEYLRRFGFGTRTGLGFPDESPGLLLDPDDWSGTSMGSIPIGHSVAVTPMQLLAAYNVIANDGVYTEPQLVRGTVDSQGHTVETRPPATRRVISEETARQVRDMMVAVVEAGTGRQATIDGYAVAGKTGTARKPQPGGGYENAAGQYEYVTTFAGFVPAEEPQLSIVVVIDEPSAGIYASQVAAPVFAELAAYALRQFSIPPAAGPYEFTVPRPTDAEEPIVVEPEPTVVRSAPAVAPPDAGGG